MLPKLNLTLLQKKLGYQFNDQLLLKQSLTHRSAYHLHNERLEFLGDAVLGSVIASQLYQQFPQADEGQLSRLRAFLVKEKALAELANELLLGDFLILGGGELKSGGYRRESILSDTFEAIIGAVLLDSDYETAQTYVLNLYREKLSKISLDKAKKDPKTQLQEWLQARNQQTPIYDIVRSTGKDHAKLYWVSCKIQYQDKKQQDKKHQSTKEQSIQVEGHGASRRKAEQDAASNAMEIIQLKSNNQ